MTAAAPYLGTAAPQGAAPTYLGSDGKQHPMIWKPGKGWVVGPGYAAAMASGGIVNRPTLAMIGERGPEAVIPLSRGGGVGMTVVVNVHGSVWQERDLVQAIRDGLLQGPGSMNPSLFGTRA